MHKTLAVAGSVIPYTFQHSARSRGIRVTVHHDGTVRVSASPRVSMQRVDQFMQSKATWILAAIARIRKLPKKEALGTGTRTEYLQNRKAALLLATERLKHFNERYGFRYKKITIRNTTSRWGSCSRQGNLSFTYKIIFLKPNELDYIIVHELCHLGAFNHSKKFWDLVSVSLPHHRVIRRSLRRFTLR